MSKYAHEIIVALTQACINVRAAEAFLYDEYVDCRSFGEDTVRQDANDMLRELLGLRDRAVARYTKEKTDGR